jgi:hypothetical protein
VTSKKKISQQAGSVRGKGEGNFQEVFTIYRAWHWVGEEKQCGRGRGGGQEGGELCGVTPYPINLP